MISPSVKTSVQAPAAFSTLNWTLILVSLPFGILNFVLPIYGKQIGGSAVEIGALFSAFSVMTIALRPLVGTGIDRYGRRWFFIAGLAAYGLAMVFFAYATTLWGLLAAQVLQGTAYALLWLAASAIVADLAGAGQRARAFGNISQSANQGGIIGTFIGFGILFSSGIASSWKQLFLMYAAAGLVAALIAWRRMPETLPDTVPDTVPGTVTKVESSVWQGLRAIRVSRSLMALLFAGLITGASSAMISPILMIFLQEKFQAGVTDLAWAFLPSAMVWAVLPTRLGGLADRFGRKPLMVVAMLAAAVNSFVMPRLSSLVTLAALWAIEAVCFAASGPASQALITDLTEEHQRGRVFGAFALSGGLGAVLGPLAGGWLYDTANQSAPFIANSAALVVGALVLGLFLKEKAASGLSDGQQR